MQGEVDEREVLSQVYNQGCRSTSHTPHTSHTSLSNVQGEIDEREVLLQT